jgi:hypothetical protein
VGNRELHRQIPERGHSHWPDVGLYECSKLRMVEFAPVLDPIIISAVFARGDML